MENYGEYYVLGQSEMHDLSAHVKFHEACFQSPQLIISKIVAKICRLFTEKWITFSN